MNNSYLQGKIAVIQAQIDAYEDAFLQLGSTGIQSYTIDTGQTRQTVTRANLSEMRIVLDNLYNRLATLQARLTGCGVTHIRPGW